MAILSFWQLCFAAIILVGAMLFPVVSAQCKANVRSTREKFRNSPLVILGNFTQYRSRFANSVHKWAEFTVLEIYKRNTTSVQLGSTVFLPLYSGHGRTSRKIWCLNDRMLRRNSGRKFVLFLKKSRETEGGTPVPPTDIQIDWTYDSLFIPVPETDRVTQFIRRLINTERPSVTLSPSENSMATQETSSENEENAVRIKAETVFELQIDTSQSHDSPIIIQTAEASEKEQLRVRCRVDGEVHQGNPDLGWVFKGQLLQETDSLKIDIDESGRETNLRIHEFKSQYQGDYECSVRRTDNNYHKTKLDLKLRTKPKDPSETGEQVCGTHWNTFCQNGGTCYEHIESKSKSCKCPPNTSGEQCQYVDTVDVVVEKVDKIDPSTKCEDIACSRAHAEYQRSMIMMGSIFGAVLLVILICLIYFYQRGKFRRERRHLLSESEAQHSSSAIRYHTRLANGGAFNQFHSEDTKHLLSKCQNCGNEVSMDHPDGSGIPVIASMSSTDLGYSSHHDRAPAITSGFLANGRPASLPSSVGTSPNVSSGINGIQRKDFFPFDPHCSQCVAEWRHISFSFPGPVAQGFQYATIPQHQIVSQEFLPVSVGNEGGYPVQMKRQQQFQRQHHFEAQPRKERHYGISDDALLSSPLPDEGSMQASFSGGIQHAKSLSRETSNASSSHEHQSFAPKFPGFATPPSSAQSSILGGSVKKSGPTNKSQERTVRFEDQRRSPSEILPHSSSSTLQDRGLCEEEETTVAWITRVENEDGLEGGMEEDEAISDMALKVKETSLGEYDIVPPVDGEVDVTVAKI